MRQSCRCRTGGMRTTKAYIASAGTAGVMLAASLCILVLVSSFVAFGSWPGSGTGTDVNQVVLRSVQRHAAAPKVTVHRNAVLLARRAEARRLALARVPVSAAPHVAAGPVTGTPNLPSTITVAQAPSSGSSPGSGGGTGGQVGDVQRRLRDTTTQVQNDATQVQQQVDQVVGQVIGGPQADSPTGGSGGTVDTVTSILGH